MDIINLLGYIAAILTTFSFVPQVLRALKNKSTGDISMLMYIIFVLGIAFWLIYGIMLGEAPIIAANSVTLVLASIILILKIIYK